MVQSKEQFFIAPLIKSFTVQVVMQWVETGQIDLDAPAQGCLPEFTLADPPIAGQITLKVFLN